MGRKGLAIAEVRLIGDRVWDAVEAPATGEAIRGVLAVLTPFLDDRKYSEEGLTLVVVALHGIAAAAAAEATCRERGARYDTWKAALDADTGGTDEMVDRLNGMWNRARAVDNPPEPSAN